MDPTSLLRTLGSLGAVLGLLSLALWATRRYNIRLPGATQMHGQRRLAVVERVAVDGRRSIALIRRDGREHLILISPEGHHVVETGIEAPVPEPVAAEPGDFASILAATNAAQDRPSIQRDASAALRKVIVRVAPMLAASRARAHVVAAHAAARAAKFRTHFDREVRPFLATITGKIRRRGVAAAGTLRQRLPRATALSKATWHKIALLVRTHGAARHKPVRFAPTEATKTNQVDAVATPKARKNVATKARPARANAAKTAKPRAAKTPTPQTRARG